MTAVQLAGAILCLAFCALVVRSCLPEESEMRMKVHMAIDTPNGTAEGASVIALQYSRAPAWFPSGTGNRNGVRVIGEAPHVDLGYRRTLFMLIEDPWGGRPQMMALGNLLSAKPEGGELRERDVPTLVTFRDPARVTSIVRVDPTNPSATLGAGYALRRIWIEPTTEKPRFGLVERVLPFRSALEQPGVQRIERDGTKTSLTYPPPNDARWISWSAFQQGGSSPSK